MAVLADHHPSPVSLVQTNDLSLAHYTLPVNLLSFLSFGTFRPSLSLDLKLIGLPLSISAPGYEAIAKGGVLEWTRNHSGPGLSVLMNMPPSAPDAKDFVPVRTLPTTTMTVGDLSFEAYLNRLRSPYRYRMQRYLNHLGKNLVRKVIAPKDFDDALYQLYLETYKRSKYPLEKMPLAYFKRLPAHLIAYYTKSGEALGFCQSIIVNKCFYFIFCGLNYDYLATHQTYVTLLCDLMRTALNAGVDRIDFGQTTELLKLKLGLELEPRTLYIYTKSTFLRACALALAKPLSYDLPPLPTLHVFKKA